MQTVDKVGVGDDLQHHFSTQLHGARLERDRDAGQPDQYRILCNDVSVCIRCKVVLLLIFL